MRNLIKCFLISLEFTIKCLLFNVSIWWLFLIVSVLGMNTHGVLFLKMFFWFLCVKCLIRIFVYVPRLDGFWIFFFLVFVKFCYQCYAGFVKKINKSLLEINYLWIHWDLNASLRGCSLTREKNFILNRK